MLLTVESASLVALTLRNLWSLMVFGRSAFTFSTLGISTMKTQFKILSCALVAFAAMTVPAQAGLIFGFDPDGAGAASEVTVDTFDFAPGNALADNVIFGGGVSPGDSFDLLYQAQLSVGLSNNIPTVVPGTTFAGEITAVSQFPEVITSVGGSSVEFGLGGAGENYFRMYYDDVANADNLAGTGFDDGVLILEGVITRNSGSFTSDLGNVQDFDQSPDGDQYGGFNSVTGEGGINITAEVTSFDSDFFGDEFGGVQEIVVALFSGSNNTPFVNVNPSQEFAFAGVDPDLGATNGLTGPDFQFQADSAISFQERVVPEPASIAMFAGLGVVGLIGAYRRRKKA